MTVDSSIRCTQLILLSALALNAILPIASVFSGEAQNFCELVKPKQLARLSNISYSSTMTVCTTIPPSSNLLAS